jgi:lysine-N-methylase
MMEISEQSTCASNFGSSAHADSANSSVDKASRPSHPTYAAAFRCAGPSCEDPCCGDWDIPLDKNTYEKYQQFPSKKLGDTVSQFVIVNQTDQREQLYGQILRTSSGSCPFFGADHLCGIQKEYGNQLLSASCSIYPRSLSIVEERLEGALSLSCPEAARNVLLTTDFMHSVCNINSGNFRTDNFYRLDGTQGNSTVKPHSIFLPIRKMLIDLVMDRSRKLPDRLLMIGHLCKRLSAMDAGQSQTTLLSNLCDLGDASKNPLVQAEINRLPNDPRLRVETIFGLTDIVMRHEPSSRFQEIFSSFVAGIVAPAGSSRRSDIETFLTAERDYYSPFFEASPFILENYLINYIFKYLFPYGRSGSDSFIPQGIFTEYLQMTTQFAWMNGLLIGAAGHHKDAFNNEHVVKVIQSFSRAVEHDPNVHRSMHRYISSHNLHSLLGMAIMLKH